MNEKEKHLFQAIYDFCRASVSWGSKESEAATVKVNDIVTILVDDASRIAAVSKDTLEAINSMRELINNLTGDGKREVANELAKALSESAKEDQQIDRFVSPIIEALQFQDRITQNMSNLLKITDVWLKTREKFAGKSSISKEELVAFGEQLLDCTTMIEERDLIRSKIEGLPDDKPTTDVLFF